MTSLIDDKRKKTKWEASRTRSLEIKRRQFPKDELRIAKRLKKYVQHPDIREMQIEIALRFCLTPFRIPVSTKATMLVHVGKQENSLYCWWGCQYGDLEEGMEGGGEGGMEGEKEKDLPYDPAIPLPFLGIYPKNIRAPWMYG